MLEKYNKFNESRRNKGRRSTPFVNSRQRENNINQTIRIIETRGMPLELSSRFKFIINIIADKGNAIAKDILKNLNNPNVKFEYSYLDLTGRADTISYLPNGERNLPEQERYKSNKRQNSKVYKVIKTIFGSKYTKTDVTKFVSMFKQVFESGKSNRKQENIVSKEIDQKKLLEKLITDTKNDKIKWVIIKETGNYFKYEFKIKITEKKHILIWYFYFPLDNIKDLIILNMKTSSNNEAQWLLTIVLDDNEFNNVFKEKYIK